MITQTQLLQYLKISTPAWLTATAYKYGNYVIQSNVIYQCLADHTSGTFATDLGNGKWAIDASNTFINGCLNQAIDEVNNYCNRDFRANTYTYYFKGDGLSYAFIPNTPINSVTSLKILDTDTNLYTDNVIDGPGDTISNTLVINDNDIELLKGYSFYRNSKYQIIYTGGYAINALWITGTVYAIGNYVTNNGNQYVCLEAHTAGTFATDLTAGKWVLSTVPFMPQDIAIVVMEKAAWIFKESPNGAGFLGLSAVNIGGQASNGTSLDRDSMIERHEKIMDKRRHWNI